MISKNTLNPTSYMTTLSPWRVLVVDNDPHVHAVTRTILNDVKFENRSVEMLSAYSDKEARQLLTTEKNIAVMVYHTLKGYLTLHSMEDKTTFTVQFPHISS